MRKSFLESRKKGTEVGREAGVPCRCWLCCQSCPCVGLQVEVVSSRWFSPFFSSSLNHLSWACCGVSWLFLIWRYCLLCVVCVLCCCPALVPCRETVWVLCHPVCSRLPPLADLPAGCHCTALSDTWLESDLKGETPIWVLDLPWTTPATGSVQRSLP